mmetsp:Transcript_4000/g.7510  ORF Transcript_4000/g.7510 Transcript_4000/m.7510 type:complete len:267 (-) Transcript_4000:140-940(-)
MQRGCCLAPKGGADGGVGEAVAVLAVEVEDIEEDDEDENEAEVSHSLTGVKGILEEGAATDILERPEAPPKSRLFLITGGDANNSMGFGGREEEVSEVSFVESIFAAPPRAALTGALAGLIWDLFLILHTSVMMPLSSSIASAAEQPLLSLSTFTALETASALAASLTESSGCCSRIAESCCGLVAGGGCGGDTGTSASPSSDCSTCAPVSSPSAAANSEFVSRSAASSRVKDWSLFILSPDCNARVQPLAVALNRAKAAGRTLRF